MAENKPIARPDIPNAVKSAGCFFGIQKQPAHRQPISPHLAPAAAQPIGSFFHNARKETPMKLQRIPALRHKLHTAGIAGEPIRTHHGLGYSFAES